MAEDKKSFVAYSDWDGMFQALPDDVAGRLVKHIFSYVNDRNPVSEDYIINALFEQVKATLKRDLKKWELQREQRSIAGKRSAEIRSTKTNDRSSSLNKKKRKPTDNVTVIDSVTVNDTEINKCTYVHWIDEFIKTKLNQVKLMKFQMELADMEEIDKKFKQDSIKKILDAMDNKPDLLKKYVKVGATLKNWLAREGEGALKEEYSKYEALKEYNKGYNDKMFG